MTVSWAAASSSASGSPPQRTQSAATSGALPSSTSSSPPPAVTRSASSWTESLAARAGSRSGWARKGLRHQHFLALEADGGAAGDQHRRAGGRSSAAADAATPPRRASPRSRRAPAAPARAARARPRSRLRVVRADGMPELQRGGRCDEFVVGDRRQRDPAPAAPRTPWPRCGLQRQPGLADPALAGDRRHRARLQRVSQLGELRRAPDHGRRWRWAAGPLRAASDRAVRTGTARRFRGSGRYRARHRVRSGSARTP